MPARKLYKYENIRARDGSGNGDDSRIATFSIQCDIKNITTPWMHTQPAKMKHALTLFT